MNEKKAELLKKVLSDAAFKAALLKDPKAEIEKATGVKLPTGVTVKIVEDTASVVHFVLPQATLAPAGAMTEADLSKVAGGASLATKIMQCTDNTGGESRCVRVNPGY